MLLVKDFFIFPSGCTEGLSLRAEGKVRSVACGQQRGRAHSGGGAGAGEFAHQSPVCRWRAMVGPTGESNFYAVLPRGVVLCLTYDDIQRDAHLLHQLAEMLAVGSRALWSVDRQVLWQTLASRVQTRVALERAWRLDSRRLVSTRRCFARGQMPICRLFAAPWPPGRDRSSASSGLRPPVSTFRWNAWCSNAR